MEDQTREGKIRLAGPDPSITKNDVAIVHRKWNYIRFVYYSFLFLIVTKLVYGPTITTWWWFVIDIGSIGVMGVCLANLFVYVRGLFLASLYIMKRDMVVAEFNLSQVDLIKQLKLGMIGPEEFFNKLDLSIPTLQSMLDEFDRSYEEAQK